MTRLPDDSASAHLLDLAWAAGLYEGEGCCIAHVHKRSMPTLSLRLQSCDEDVLRRFHKIVGCGTVIGPHVAMEGRKPHWRWSASKETDCIEVLRAFWPWLGVRRREQAWIAIEKRGVPLPREEWLHRVRVGQEARRSATTA